MTSVSNGPWGPCCSVEPVGTITVSCADRKASSSRFVISPRNTVGGFIGSASSCVVSGDLRRELADSLDPARHDVTWLEMTVGPGRRGQAGRGPGRDQITGAEREMVAEECDDRRDREPHLRGASVLDRLAVDRAPEAEIGGVHFADGDEAW